MTAISIPEEIVPSTLVSYTGQDFTTVITGGMPNGDDYLQVNGVASQLEKGQKAFQTRRTDSHLLRTSPQVNALSFWIRRNQNFAAFGPVMSVSTAGVESGMSGLLFGVGNPNTDAASPHFAIGRSIAWAVFANSATNIQFAILGQRSSTFYWFPTQSVGISTDWQFVVINLEPYLATGLNPTGGNQLFRNATPIGGIVDTSGSAFYTPDSVSDYDIARFAIGDPTARGRAVESTSVGPLYDIGKLTMHNQTLSPLDQLELIEAMRYGP